MEALICRHLIKHFSKQLPLNSIGVASPYGMQAEVIAELTKDIDPDEKVLISTVHKFQGGEKDTIIFTAVDGPGKSFKSSMLNDRRDDSSAEVLLNVAISRARKKLVFIANVAYLQRQAGADSLISNVLEKFRSEGKVISASDLPFDEGLDAIDLQFSKMRKPGAAAQRIRSLRFLDERSFWPDFYNELDRCSQSLDIVTGFVGQLRSQDLLGRFKQLSKRGVRISLYTRPPAEHGTIPTQSVVTALNSLRAAGVHIYTRHETHQKCAVIDGQVAWHGSLNIMSHQGAHEQMIRIENKAEIFSMLQGLLLDRFSPWC
jgi:phosphatidylserine/phosphatidylglycerophosphate/cardiolipin synthase-like enzyme